ncbi:MAG: alpha/beta fold hydrolase [Angelakisella sp.]|jgi:pimeloyl-ACP methyl ester carboxylesterase|nr:alpha/beta fold hydrolase [Angelakisella sp.]MCI9528688.1 alpha/beta fold hydrolase [Angelakisella sp.]
MKLLLLHGLGQGPGSWDGVLDALGPDPGAACPDLFGLCGGAPDYPALYAAFEDYAGALPEPVLLCGLSLGSVLALDYAIRRPEKIAGLVLVAPQYKMPRALLRLQNAVFRMMPERAFAQTGLGKRDILRLTASMMDLDLRDGLARVDCPALILVGEKDAANRKAARELAGLLPRATVREVPGAGHEVNVDAPRELAEALRGFWEKL